MRSQTAVAAIGAILIALCSAVSARADLKIVSEVTITGMPTMGTVNPDAGKPTTQTNYYKGDKFRQESVSSISIFDCGAGQIYTLNPDKKTYTVRAVDDMLNMSDNPMLAKMKVDVSGDVKPTDKTEMIADRKAKEFLYSIDMQMSMEGMDSSMFPKMKMSGEQWNTTSLNSLSNISISWPPLPSQTIWCLA